MLISVAVATGADVWMDKPFRNWSSGDVKKILSSSPWAKPLLMPYYPQRGAGQIEIERTETTVFRIGRGAASDSDVFDPEPKDTYCVRWDSSRTVRRAIYRQRILRGAKAAPAEEEDLATSSEGIQITISSPSNLTRWPQVTEEEWAEFAHLEAEETGRRAEAFEVKKRPGVAGIDGQTVVFYFPKSLDDGEPLFDSKSTHVTFSAQVGPRIYQVTFNPSLMVAVDGADF
jgi:hypothetical protein